MLVNTTIQPPAMAENNTFTFVITTAPGGAGGLNRIIVSPETAGEPGMYEGGHARINRRGSGIRKIVWVATQSFKIDFQELSSNAEIGQGNKDDLFSSTHDQSNTSFRFEGNLRGGSGIESVAYKYIISNMAGCEDLDPLIIVDR
jgi:hypothetical protein